MPASGKSWRSPPTTIDTVTGELDKAAQTYQEEIESYPRESGAYHDLGVVYAAQGQYEKARRATQASLRLAPDAVGPYANLANYALALQRFDEARQMIQQAQARKMDDFDTPQCSLCSCLSRGGFRGDGGTATVVCGQARRERLDWRSHPTPRPTPVICARRGN